jgi:hypothetical protein
MDLKNKHALQEQHVLNWKQHLSIIRCNVA